MTKRSLPRSPLAPGSFPELPRLAGVRLGGFCCGIKKSGRPDLFVALCPPGSRAALVTTRSRTRSAPIDWCRQVLETSRGHLRGVIANSGNANAFTGARGWETIRLTIDEACRLTGCQPHELAIASTGVIGEFLDGRQIAAHLAAAYGSLSGCDWHNAAQAIMTTDTFPKGATASFAIDGVTFQLCGIAKGSGMIAPDMGTMLAFLFTDAPVETDLLQPALERATDRSFNCITVDGDTSTSDTVTLMATHGTPLPGGGVIDRQHPGRRAFRRALQQVTRDLACQIVRDGEGATKLIEIRVTGASSWQAARRVGLAVGNSPLVKTAIGGGDANWGRVVMAVGKSGARAERDRIRIRMGGVTICEKGGPVDRYDEAPVAAHLAEDRIELEIDLGLGRGQAVVWTCDLTERYIGINGAYRS